LDSDPTPCAISTDINLIAEEPEEPLLARFDLNYSTDDVSMMTEKPTSPLIKKTKREESKSWVPLNKEYTNPDCIS